MGAGFVEISDTRRARSKEDEMQGQYARLIPQHERRGLNARPVGRLRPLAWTMLLVICPTLAASITQGDPSDMTVDAAMRLEVIEGALKHIHDHYAYPEAATQMDNAIRERLRKGEYDRIISGASLATTLTAHLQQVREDPHLRVEFTAKPGSSTSDTAVTVMTPQEEQAQRETWLRYGSSRNFFIDRADRLGGNVGYLKLTGFFFVDMTKDTLSAAMNFLAHTDALIIDLRESGGGDVAMTELFLAYFLDKSVNPNMTGKQYLEKDVYVLTSKEIYSAPEGVARALQSKNRAVIVGETTRGVTNVTAGYPINRYFSVSVPYKRTIDASGTDLSRQGVKPDIEVSAAKALDTAYLAAVTDLLGQTSDGEIAEQRRGTIDLLQKRLK